MNNVEIMGNVGREIRVRKTNTGKSVSSFSVAVNKRVTVNGEERVLTTWIDVVAWGDLADACARELKKGSYIMVQGRLQKRSYTNNSGADVWVTEVVANSILRPLSKKAERAEEGSTFAEFGTVTRTPSEEEIPF